MRHRVRIGLLVLLCGIPAVARADRVLHGLFVAQPVEGVIESYHFHRNHTYEWSRDFDGRHQWACGRYRFEGQTLVLLEDPSKQSCKNGTKEAKGPLAEHWLPVETMRGGALKLGGERYARAASSSPDAALTSTSR